MSPASPPSTKRSRVSTSQKATHTNDHSSGYGGSSGEEANVSDTGSEGEGSGQSSDTEEEIAAARASLKSSKTQKRKRRATSPSQFGATLQSLLGTSVANEVPLALKPSLSRKSNREKLDVKARKLLEGEKKEKEEKNHIVDVIGGWGGESERALRKTAQRGVVKLFNVIQQAQSAAAAEKEEAKSHRGSGKPFLDAPSLDSKSKGKKQKSKPTGSSTNGLGQDDFLKMIKSGGIVSTT